MTISLDTILEKALREQPLTRGEIIHLLRIKEEGEQKKVFEVARKLRGRYFGSRIFLLEEIVWR
jgi:methylornithine synthase